MILGMITRDRCDKHTPLVRLPVIYLLEKASLINRGLRTSTLPICKNRVISTDGWILALTNVVCN